MNLLRRVVRVRDLDEPVRLHTTGDWHVGEHGCAEHRLRESCELIGEDPRALVLYMGDLASYIAPEDRRWEPRAIADGLTIEDLSDWGGVLTERVADVARPIQRGKALASITGNHELTYANRHHSPVGDHLAHALGCPSVGYTALITLTFAAPGASRSLRIFATHGSGSAATASGKLNRLTKTMGIAVADLVLMGHVHTYTSTVEPRIVQGDGRVEEVCCLGVITGTYLRTYTEGHSGYGERAGYQPTPLGHPVIEIVPSTLEMSVSLAR